MTISRAVCRVTIFLALCASSPLLAQLTAPPSDLDAYVTSVLKTFAVPGLSVAIVKSGRVVLAEGYGIRKIGDSTRVDEHTLFGIGSNTKAFTSALLAKLVDEGKITWEDNVRQQIFAPLGMSTTNLTNASWKSGDNYAWPHSRLPGKMQAIDFVPLDNAAPAGAINSSASEMARWVLLQLNHGKFPDANA